MLRLAVQSKGMFLLPQAPLPLIADSGRIVNVSSGLTRFSLPRYAAHAMMKRGVEVFTRYLAKELGSRGIAVNTIAPGVTEIDPSVVSCVTTPGSKRCSQGSSRWTASACLRIPARPSPLCCPTRTEASKHSASKSRAACFCSHRSACDGTAAHSSFIWKQPTTSFIAP